MEDADSEQFVIDAFLGQLGSNQDVQTGQKGVFPELSWMVHVCLGVLDGEECSFI